MLVLAALISTPPTVAILSLAPTAYASTPPSMTMCVRPLFVIVLTAALGERRVIAERPGPGGHSAMQRWMRGYGSGLPKQPDIVICDLA